MYVISKHDQPMMSLCDDFGHAKVALEYTGD